jgi:hypothetical protein
LEAEATKLQNLLSKWASIESQRRMKIENIWEKAKGDDINITLLVETARLERKYLGT